MSGFLGTSVGGILGGVSVGSLVSAAAGATRPTWQLLYQVNPLFLTGGNFSSIPGGIFPFSALAGALLGVVQGAVSSGEPWLGEWRVLPGAKMVNQSVAVYPFASQQIAANATVQEPLSLSMMFIAPVKDTFGYATKPAIFSSIQAALISHNNSGGTYTIFTPSLFYQNGILLNVFDATAGGTKQEQVYWQFDFFFPLITQSGATAALNGVMNKIQGGNQLSLASFGL